MPRKTSETALVPLGSGQADPIKNRPGPGGPTSNPCQPAATQLQKKRPVHTTPGGAQLSQSGLSSSPSDPKGQRQSGVKPLPNGCLPYASQPQEVASVLSKHIAALRNESPDAVHRTYSRLEPGYHFVFRREICLKNGQLSPNDHKGKRALRLMGHETLAKAFATTEETLKVFARLLEKARIEVVKTARVAEPGRHATQPLVIIVAGLERDAKESFRLDVQLQRSDQGLTAIWKAPPQLSFQKLEQLSSLADVTTSQRLGLKQRLGKCAFLGGGGGSDVIQAAAVAQLIQKYTPIEVGPVISIRTLYSKSTSAGEKRSVWDANDKSQRNQLDSADGNLKLEPNHRGNARFVEDAILNQFQNVRLVIDDKSQDRLRRTRYESAIGDVGGIFVIDTGGDVLGGMDPSAAKKAPDQDCRTQLVTAQIAAAKHLDAIVAIAAPGVDAPPDAQRKLEASNAVFYRFTPSDKEFLTRCYGSMWHFNGSPENLRKFPEHYGKTPFAMLASFKLKDGQSAFHALPLPESVINDFDNPWACITWVTPEMSCLVLANQAKLLSVIAPQR